MSDELVHRLRVADADTKAIFGEDFVSTQGEAADEIERLTLDWAREQGERTSAELARDQALLEIERLRAEVAEAGRRYADSESRLALCDAALQDMQRERDAAFSMSRCECAVNECCANIVKQMRQAATAESALAALRKRVEKSVVLAIPEAPSARPPMHGRGHDAQLVLHSRWAVSHGLAGKRVALVVLDEG